MTDRYVTFFSMLFLFICSNCAQITEKDGVNSKNHTSNDRNTINEKINVSPKNNIDTAGTTLYKRILVPEGYMRKEENASSFGYFLRNLPVKKHGSLVQTYNGKYKPNSNIYDAVVDLPIGKKDLHQCADAIMRLRAEWLWNNKRYSEIHFNFTSGWRCDYSEWIKGKRVKIANGKPIWVQQTSPSNTSKDLWSFLELIFTYAGTLSLSKELQPIPLSQMEIGDIFIKGGSPGHAVLIADMAINPTTGEKLFLLLQSYMPAQEIQLLKNNDVLELSPWYSEEQAKELHTPEWDFTGNQIMRFK